MAHSKSLRTTGNEAGEAHILQQQLQNSFQYIINLHAKVSRDAYIETLLEKIYYCLMRPFTR